MRQRGSKSEDDKGERNNCRRFRLNELLFWNALARWRLVH